MTDLITTFPWPDDIIDQAQEHNLVLFVGAGVSSTATFNGVKSTPPNWIELLKLLQLKLGFSEIHEIEVLISGNYSGCCCG
jgi:hypothetical protein